MTLSRPLLAALTLVTSAAWLGPPAHAEPKGSRATPRASASARSAGRAAPIASAAAASSAPSPAASGAPEPPPVEVGAQVITSPGSRPWATVELVHPPATRAAGTAADRTQREADRELEPHAR